MKPTSIIFFTSFLLSILLLACNQPVKKQTPLQGIGCYPDSVYREMYKYADTTSLTKALIANANTRFNYCTKDNNSPYCQAGTMYYDQWIIRATDSIGQTGNLIISTDSLTADTLLQGLRTGTIDSMFIEKKNERGKFRLRFYKRPNS